MDRVELLKELTGAFGISGYENTVVDILKKHFGDRVEITKDRLGSLIACKKGKSDKPKIMFAAHMDEIGFMVKKITKQGYIRFLPIGGWYAGNLPSLRVRVMTKKGDYIPGVIGLKPIHEMNQEELKKLPEIKDMYIDVGTTDKFDIKEKLGIRPGDPVIPDTPFQQLANSDLYMAKAWDNRVGCALLVDLLNNIVEIDHPNTVYLVGTVQEEVGLRGAKTSASAIAPDVAFALDVSICRDTPGNENESAEKLGAGVGILVYDRTMIPHRKVKELVCKIADLHNIPYHFTSIKGGYDTGTIHLTNYGVPSLALGVPTRYVHTGSSIVSLEDYEHVLNLITLIVKDLNNEIFEKITE